MLLATGTTLNIESFMGAIMAMGISVANAILLVTFAERARLDGAVPREAAIEGARSRIRAILMTATAMTAGMIPMAVASGERALAAPLGRAVIGGLVVATVTTLTVLPAVYAIMQGRASNRSASLNPDDPSSRYYERA
jgi:multidrug efflux pump subunit AcrB